MTTTTITTVTVQQSDSLRDGITITFHVNAGSLSQ